MQDMENTTKAAIALGILSAAATAGFITGRSTSRSSDKPTTADLYLFTHSHWTKIDGTHDRIDLPAGIRRFTYTTDSPKVWTDYIPADELVQYKQPIDLDNDYQKLTALVVAPPAEGGLLAFLLKPASNTFRFTKVEATVVTIATVGTFGLGYYLGHRTAPDFDNPKFVEELMNVALWQNLVAA